MASFFCQCNPVQESRKSSNLGLGRHPLGNPASIDSIGIVLIDSSLSLEPVPTCFA
jgi:hypothetical protein